MKTTATILTLLVILLPVHGEKIAELGEVLKPATMDVGSGRLFIAEGTTIHIYSLENFKQIKTFGKAGEGPQEFKVSPFGIPLILFEMDGTLYVSSDTKLSLFTLDGEFIREIKVPPFQVFVPIAQGKFVASGTAAGDDQQMFLNIGLYDEKVRLVKELYRSDTAVGPNANFIFPYSSFAFSPQGEEIFVVIGKEGFVIDVFDLEGKRVRRIQKDTTPLPVPDSYKKSIDDWLKRDPGFKQFYEFFKTRLKFKSHFPAIMDMIIENNRIYVFTYKHEGHRYELIILDLQGKERGRVRVPIPGLVGNLFKSPIYAIDRGFYYVLMENEDDEIWELHRVELR